MTKIELKKKESDYVEHFYNKSREEALGIVESLSREILKEHTDLKEFIMAMGVFFFVHQDGRILYPKFDKAEMLKDFIGRWDKDLSLTGEAMRFTSEGKKITHW